MRKSLILESETTRGGEKSYISWITRRPQSVLGYSSAVELKMRIDYPQGNLDQVRKCVLEAGWWPVVVGIIPGNYRRHGLQERLRNRARTAVCILKLDVIRGSCTMIGGVTADKDHSHCTCAFRRRWRQLAYKTRRVSQAVRVHNPTVASER
jgi:hypothetical protein